LGFEPQHRVQLSESYRRLKGWLIDEVFPRWAQYGVDAHGGFVEALGFDGIARPQPRRMRVQPRQVFAFAHASELGWNGDSRDLLRRGLAFLIRHYQRPDGLFGTLIDADGAVLDARALLYDQSFALLAYAAAAHALDACDEYEAHALALRQRIEQCLRAADGTFFSDLERKPLREPNPHMHLLEACLAWAEIGTDPQWRNWVESLVSIGLHRFVRRDSGLIGESYTASGVPTAGLAGRIIEPGHQFEWAWLLLRSEQSGSAARSAALRIIDVTEQFGVQGGFAVNALLDDLSVHNAGARFWPQTERLKAALLAAQATNDLRYGAMACAAATSLFAYFNLDTPGLWFDLPRPAGGLVRAAAPASTLYHIVAAVVALHRALIPKR
jgi:mannose/cellobiose epimerase-like protein (N-acyl-D-glucosamine 2-epimerase family)